MDNKTSGYHLFFEPSGSALSLLKDTITKLSEEYGGPLFEPHLTLLATIPAEDESLLVRKAAALAEGISPFILTLEGYGAEDTFFRALYMRTLNDGEVSGYHRQAQAIFGGDDPIPYVPHVSLLYGKYDAERKANSIEVLKSLGSISFPVTALTLWETPGEASTWRRVQAFPFQHGA